MWCAAKTFFIRTTGISPRSRGARPAGAEKPRPQTNNRDQHLHDSRAQGTQLWALHIRGQESGSTAILVRPRNPVGQPLMMQPPDRGHGLHASARPPRASVSPDLARAARPGRGFEDGEAAAELSDSYVQSDDRLPFLRKGIGPILWTWQRGRTWSRR